ncbi:MAG TPA: 3-isopropylmalate dehydratase small subunit [Symbiobacteriaceae bacterium]|nr:3-isopropylmalate dehydratase small subunit [Symbiobacteriaceae bacterium]
MKPFVTHTGTVVPLDRANVDTDQLVPKQFLKRIERTGFGAVLFHSWRYGPDGAPLPDFVLNAPKYAGATILVASRNFGSGSSREHAVWALTDYGFRAVIAPSFADIFYNNCFKNGLLPVTLPEETVNQYLRRAEAEAGLELTVDLSRCVVVDSEGHETPFELDPFRQYCMLEGLDDIELTLRHADLISAFEANQPAWLR